jgi:hypothetical protein
MEDGIMKLINTETMKEINVEEDFMSVKKEKQENPLFAIDKSYKIEWQGMPECTASDLKSKIQIIVSFVSEDDMNKFAKLVDQKITTRTKSSYYPKMDNFSVKDKRYIDG